MASILTRQQALALQHIATTNLAQQFYFSGGTALTHYYLQHRLSEDLDFFNFEEFDPQGVFVTLKSLQKRLGYTFIDFQNSMNRNLFFLHYSNQNTLKLEFTYYPFQQVEEPMMKDGLLVDSIIDIATNKLFTISQNPRGRDYYDLHGIIQKFSYSTEQLRMLAKQKFDWHIDPLQLASRFHEASQHLDDPILTTPISSKTIAHFFANEALSLGKEILEQ